MYRPQSHKVTKLQSRVLKLFMQMFLTCVLVSLCPCVLVFAQPISSTELINNAKLYDGKIVSYSGEVIGDVMARGEFAWVNVNDGKNAIGIWLPQNLTKDIFYTGSYKSKGDVIEATGTLQRACLQHGGDLDIHAQAIRKLNSGRALAERPNIAKRNFSLALLGVLCLALILRQLKPKSKK